MTIDGIRSAKRLREIMNNPIDYPIARLYPIVAENIEAILFDILGPDGRDKCVCGHVFHQHKNVTEFLICRAQTLNGMDCPCGDFESERETCLNPTLSESENR